MINGGHYLEVVLQFWKSWWFVSLVKLLFGCERNWSVFEHIHSKRRNRIEQQRLNDLIYVTYNLPLKNRYKHFFMLWCFIINMFFINYYFLLSIIEFCFYIVMLDYRNHYKKTCYVLLTLKQLTKLIFG